jgi:hypothetical protein
MTIAKRLLILVAVPLVALLGVTEEMKAALGAEFEFQERGEVEVKGQERLRSGT